jgi:lipopolysaccharide/colanic/teichoic acid biosynthesis glycosyltransferase
MATAIRDDRGEAFADARPQDTERGRRGSVSRTQLSKVVKRTLDVVIAVALLVVTLPLMVLVVIAIELESPGTPFYRARRVGYRGRPLDVLKFRKMHLGANGLPLTVRGDARLTRVGAIMSRTRIDELPQLWNVVRGQMSLVGPRPEDQLFVDLHPNGYERILQVRPGITGWSQLAFAAESRILDQSDPVRHYVEAILPAKVWLDCKYAERLSLRRDFAVMLWTAAALLMRIEVAVHRETGRLGHRRRPQTARPGFVRVAFWARDRSPQGCAVPSPATPPQ